MLILMTFFKEHPSVSVVMLLLGLQAIVLYLLQHPVICTCGYVKIWEGVVRSAGNSQHLFDWYTFSHVIHGFLFFGFFTYFYPRAPLWQRLALALGIEVGWEIIENTPYIIALYREQALAVGYSGDSIINSLCDSIVMIGGFLFASRFPARLVIVIALVMELAVGYYIRDNLTLNVLNFVHRFEIVDEWQRTAP